MGRRTGERANMQIEVDATPTPPSILTSVTSPAADVGRVYPTTAQFISASTGKHPVAYLDGVISGFAITPSSTINAVNIEQGKVQISSITIEKTAEEITLIPRPTASAANVLVTAFTIDDTGTINKTTGTEGVSNSVRGTAGAVPFLPVGEILLGYVFATYFEGIATGAKTVEQAEIASETKEWAIIPTATWTHHDPVLDVGTISLGAQLPLIHAATAAGPGTARRAVYARWSDAVFEDAPDSYDASMSEAVSTVVSRAYGEEHSQVEISGVDWSGSFSAYWSTLNDVYSIVKNDKRWVKQIPDRSTPTDYAAGLAIIAVDRSMPVADNMTATVTLTGSGPLYPKSE